MPRIALCTCDAHPDLAANEGPLVGLVRARGVECETPSWSDPRVDWRRYDAVVVRTTWDYYLRGEEFARWVGHVEQLGIPLWNPAETLLWNMHKSYLRDLQERGVAIPDTVWLTQGSSADLPRLCAEHGFDELVIKPCVSGNALGTYRVRAADAARHQGALDQLLARQDVMVQRYVPAVTSAGETSYLFYDDAFAYAVRKTPKQGDFRVQIDHGGAAAQVTPSPAQIAKAKAIVDAAGYPWVYARVDVVPRGDELLLMELELIEPALYLYVVPDGGVPFVEGLLRRLGYNSG